MNTMSFLQKLFAFLLDSAQTILLAGSVFLVIYVFLFRPFQVSGSSMHPNFVDQEYVLTNLITLQFGDPTLGDVIVFKAPIDADKDFIKRTIGVAGDKVMVKDGNVYLNGERLDESAYLSEDVKTYGGAFLQDGNEITVPNGKFFVMGDNRMNSSDSRAWGFVKRSEIIGKSMFVYWPPNHARGIANPFKK